MLHSIYILWFLFILNNNENKKKQTRTKLNIVAKEKNKIKNWIEMVTFYNKVVIVYIYKCMSNILQNKQFIF